MNIKHDDDEDALTQISDSHAPAVLAMYEAQLARVKEQVDDLHARLQASENQARDLTRRLTSVDQALSRKQALLNWISNSRSWKLTSSLRQLKFIGQKYRLRLRNSAYFVGELESPAEASLVPGFVEISGWAHSSTAPIMEVEAFIDGVPLGALDFGRAREDVSAYPSQTPINCGYRGRLVIDESFAGRHKLTVRIKDELGHIKDYGRTILIEQPRNGFSVPALSQPGDSGAASLLCDDLSIAKRLQTSLGNISLQTFLISNSVLRFPKCDHPKVSIILVLHNRAELTLQCLYSIVQSDASSYEVIIIDNASTDETWRLLKRVEGVRLISNEQNLHYLLACNQASEQAKGNYLLLLNNDAQLQRHSISSALRTLESSDDIGAVGGAIILPNGTLQEAGSIIFSDGSCAGYGRGSTPLDPAFMFKRDVDYCSAVFLLTKRDMFGANGGFDEAFIPAYYEDSDYCVRLWTRGKRVVYDPEVTVFHHEFASSASSEAAIDLQTRHRKVFVAQHRDWLDRQLAPSPTNILLARTRLQKGAKRILILDDRVAHISLGSGFPRSNRMIRELVKLGHAITCYPLTYCREDWPTVYEDLPREVEVMIDHGLPQLEQFLSDRAGYYDIVFVSRPHNMAHLRTLIQQKPHLFSGANIIYDAEALFSIRVIAEARLKGKTISSQDQQRLIDEEVKLAESCDRVVSVSQREGAEFSRNGFKHVHTLGHAFEIAPTANRFTERKGILFVGAIHQVESPNADSAIWFARKIFPRVQRLLDAEIELIFVGVMPPEIEAQLEKKSIRVLGKVKELIPLYNQCRILVAPTRFAAGLPYKVHEAAAYGLPTVATTLIGSQLGWEDGKELLLADEESDFAEACAKLHRDQALWDSVRANAINRVAKDCSPEVFCAQLRAIFE
jgi:O-antigen biosynthesis protein